MSQPNATFEDDLSALLDGELSPAEQAALEARISEDPALQAQYDALAEARAFFAEHGPVAAPADLLGDILAAADAIDREEGTVVQLPFWQKPFGVPLAGWAVAAAALLVVYVALPEMDGGAPTETSPAARAPRDYSSDVASWKSKKSAPEKAASEDAVAAAEAVEKPAADLDSEAELNDAVAVVEKPAVLEKGAKKTMPMDLKAPTSFGLTGSKSAPDDSTVQAVVGDAEGAPSAVSSKRLVPEKPPKEELKGGFAQVPYQYVLFTDDDEALAQLAAIAGRFRGEVGGPNDQPLQLDEDLSSGQEATVVVKLPAHALQDFGRAIEGLGNVYPSRDGRVFAGDPVEVRVQVKLAAGPGTPQDAAPPNAARMKQEQFEMDEVAESF